MTLPRESILSRHRIGVLEPVWWLLALLVYFFFPKHLAFASSVLVMAMFALSFDVVLGFAGILTLGNAVFFGVGAYASALIAIGGWHEAITGALAAAVISALLAGTLGPFVLRLTGLPLIMVTLGIGVIFFEAANKATWITGGDDGLSNIDLAPLLGWFRWSLSGGASYLYALAWLGSLFFFTRRIMASPFGVALQGIRENADRMRLIGTPVLRYLVISYVVSAFIAGAAGALWTQTNAFVGLGVFSLDTAIDGLVMLVLGGIGGLYGGLIGAPVYMLVKHFSQEWNPYYWMFFIGGMLILVVRLGRGGILGISSRALSRWHGVRAV